VDRLFEEMYTSEGYQLGIDLQRQIVQNPAGMEFGFDVIK
jgi:3-isopropylmalate/(R)-2-methylmalate dehydratase small subunit